MSKNTGIVTERVNFFLDIHTRLWYIDIAMHEDLTPKQKKIFEFIKQTKSKKGISPAYREIMEHFGFKSIGTVQDHLNALERKGYITREPAKYRTIGCRLIGPGSFDILDNTVRIPVVGQISAGRLVLAIENIEGYISLDKLLVRHPKDVFALKVKGDSMINAGIYDDDFVIVRQQPTAENGQIVVALINDEATVKRFYKADDKITLKAENPNIKPFVYHKGDANISILGKVIGVYRKY